MEKVRRNYFYLTVCTVLCFVLAGGAVQQAAAAEGAKEAESAKILILKSIPTGLSMDSAAVKKGETIIWVNKDPEPVRIKFKQPIGLACSSPVNFYADLLGNYETGPITQGSTASICLINAGTYDYEVRRLIKKGEKEPIEEINTGRIVVQ